MGVYIKGMDMPANCTDCFYRPFVWCNPYQDNGLSPSDHRHRTCPLTEVQEPHGRLVDMDKALEVIALEYGYDGIEDDIEYKVPTVIESEV